MERGEKEFAIRALKYGYGEFMLAGAVLLGICLFI